MFVLDLLEQETKVFQACELKIRPLLITQVDLELFQNKPKGFRGVRRGCLRGLRRCGMRYAVLPWEYINSGIRYLSIHCE